MSTRTLGAFFAPMSVAAVALAGLVDGRQDRRPWGASGHEVCAHELVPVGEGSAH
jgi:hypothetical protein